jgi:hypothetical protein
MAIILWAHRRFSSRLQTHSAPFSTPARSRGTAASNPHSTRRDQALPPDLRRTRPTLSNNAQPNRLQPKLPLLPAPLLVPPFGVNTLPAGGQGRQRRRQERHQPESLPSFAPPSSTRNKMRSAQPTQRQNTSTLRRSRCFGFGRFVALQRSANGRRWPLRQ